MSRPVRDMECRRGEVSCTFDFRAKGRGAGGREVEVEELRHCCYCYELVEEAMAEASLWG